MCLRDSIPRRMFWHKVGLLVLIHRKVVLVENSNGEDSNESAETVDDNH